MNYKKDSEGKDLLDENGNPIPEGNTDDSKDESIGPEEVKDLKDALKSVVEEVKELRAKNRELSEKINPPAPKEEVPADVTKIKEVLKSIMDEDKITNAEAIKKAAFEKFITSNKEFHPDNDVAGLKQKALIQKINQRFNLAGMTDEKDFIDVFEEASILLKKNDNSSKTQGPNNPYSSTPVSKITPGKVEDELSPKEKKLVERGSATKEYIMKLRIEKPAYLASLLERVRD